MKTQTLRFRCRRIFYVLVVGLLSLTSSAALAQQGESPETTTSEEQAPKLASGELDSLVAPIALYSDELLAQTLAASTYPLEIIQLQQWMDQNKNLQGKALADAVVNQPWDPSVQGLVAFPEVVQRMAGNIQWTTDLGNAFLDQQSDVMDAVQRMRAKAEGTGNLKTSSQQTVQTRTVEGGKQVITVESANPEVAYVPSYDPTVVYGPAQAEYPYYNYSYPGYVPGTALAWGAGVALSAAAWGNWGGYWGECDWNHGDVTVNNNYNFNKNYNKTVNKNVSGAQGGQGQWQHNPQHRGNTPYANKQTANKYGGMTRGQGGAKTGAGKGTGPGGGGTTAGNRPGNGAGTGNRPGGGAGANGKPGAAGSKPGGNKPGGGAGGKPGGGGGGTAKTGTGGTAGKSAGGGGGAKTNGGAAKNQAGNRTAPSKSGGASKSGGPGGGGGSTTASGGNRGGKSPGGQGANRAGGGGAKPKGKPGDKRKGGGR